MPLEETRCGGLIGAALGDTGGGAPQGLGAMQPSILS